MGARGGPVGVAVSPDGHSVYVTNQDSGTVSQYDVGAGGALAAKSIPTVPADKDPLGVAVSRDGHSVYVTNQASGTVSQYDVGAGGALAAKSIPTVGAGAGPAGVAVSPDGHSVYVTNGGSDTVSQYDVGAGGALAAKSPPTVPAGAGPFGVAVRGGSLPTSRQQCMDGGFRGFGVFTNEGDCLAFVATGGKNEPGKNVPTPREP